MGAPHKPDHVLLMCTIFSRYDEAVRWALERLRERWGEPSAISDFFPFGETEYYRPSMGDALRVQIAAFGEIDQGDLAGIKIWTNALEAEYAAFAPHPEARPLNLDPGYLTPDKFVLATTKDAAHRLYLGNGIFGEVTLWYARGAWQEREWTYPNYRRSDYREFLLRCRKALLARRRETNA